MSPVPGSSSNRNSCAKSIPLLGCPPTVVPAIQVHHDIVPTAPGSHSVSEEFIGRLTNLANECHDFAVRNNVLPHHASSLRSVQSLIDFRVGLGFDAADRRIKLVFAERDGKGQIIGLTCCDHDCVESLAPGGYGGLSFAPTLPTIASNNPSASLFITKGHNETIKLHSAGCMSIGRPVDLNADVKHLVQGIFVFAP